MIDTHIPDDDLVLFALQLLPEDRMRLAKKHVETCDLCRSEIAKLQGDLVAYSMTADFQAPPPATRDRVLRQVAKEPRLAPPEPEPEPEPERRPAPLPPLVPSPEDRRPHQPRIPDSVEDRRSPQSLAASEEPFFPTRQTRGQTRDQSRGLGRTLAEDELEVPPDRRRRGFGRALPEDEPEVPKERRRPGRAPWVLAWTGWAVAAGVSFFAGLQVHQRQQIQNSMAAQQARMDDTTRQAVHAQDALATLTAANAMQMPLHTTAAVKPVAAVKPGTPAPPAAPTPDALVAYLADKGALVFIGTHMEPAPAGKTYELWLLPANGGNPMPAGTFKPDAQGAAHIVMPQLPKGVPAKGFGVTVENDGGSTTPTLPIVMS